MLPQREMPACCVLHAVSARVMEASSPYVEGFARTARLADPLQPLERTARDFVSVAQGYLPQDYENLNTAYGSEADLRRCVAALRRRGLKALADVVINHRCAQQQVRGWAAPMRATHGSL